VNLEKDWRWYGNAGHFCCSQDCEFHLCTEVGEYLISTVGEYYPDGRKGGMKSVAWDKDYYETMVFKWAGRCECGCGLPEISGSEIECRRYETPEQANKGHLDICIGYDCLRPTKNEEETQ